MSLVVDDVDPSVKLKGQISFLDNQVSIDQVLHFEGLLLCILKEVTRIVVWNPYLGQTRWIDLRYSHRLPNRWRFCYALGYEDKKSCRTVKVLRFFDYFQGETQFFWYEIYDFDSGLWTTLDVNPYWTIVHSLEPGVSLKGNTYWPARERRSGITEHIICFDFRREKFGPLLPLPVGVWDDRYGCVYVTLSCVKEEKLAALFTHHFDDDFEIWITTKIDVEMVSWSKFLKMDTRTKIKVPVTFFIDEEKKILMGFDTRDDSPKTFINIIGEVIYLRKLDFALAQGRYCWPRVCSYVPSLVQIKKHARGEMVKQSSLEESHRFAQNMLRLAAFEKLVNLPTKNKW